MKNYEEPRSTSEVRKESVGRARAMKWLPECSVDLGFSPWQFETQQIKTHGNKIRVLLVDDHGIIREGMGSLLETVTDLEIIAEAANGEVGIELAREMRPDVVLMDVSMPVMSGVQATAIIHKEMPDIRVIGVSMFEDSEMASSMRQAGAVCYLTKNASLEVLISAIRACFRES